MKTNKKNLCLLLLIGFIVLPGISHASRERSPSSNKKTNSKLVNTKKTNKEKSKNLKKEMHFGDQLVNGKFQLPGDSSVEIENEKLVFNLLQIRPDFNDRRLKETTRDE